MQGARRAAQGTHPRSATCSARVVLGAVQGGPGAPAGTSVWVSGCRWKVEGCSMLTVCWAPRPGCLGLVYPVPRCLSLRCRHLPQPPEPTAACCRGRSQGCSEQPSGCRQALSRGGVTPVQPPSPEQQLWASPHSRHLPALLCKDPVIEEVNQVHLPGWPGCTGAGPGLCCYFAGPWSCLPPWPQWLWVAFTTPAQGCAAQLRVAAWWGGFRWSFGCVCR